MMSNYKIRHTYALCLLLSSALILEAWAPSAQAFSRDEITASYLYNFIKSIQWPEQEKLEHITIGLYKPENTVLAQQLSNHFAKARAHNLPITIKTLHNAQKINKVQLLFIEESNNKDIELLYRSIGSKPVALITNNHNNKQLVMINLLTTEDNRIQFEVNKANMLAQGLTVLPDIILNGGSEIDVAQLFKEGQASLVKMQNQLREKEAHLKNLALGVSSLQQENTSLNSHLTELQSSIKTTQSLLDKQQQLINTQKQTLETTNKERERLLNEVEAQTRQLNNRQFLLDDITQKISSRETKLKELNDTLIQQKSKIIELDDTIVTQSIVVNNLIALVILGLILVAVAAWAYINKRKDAERLEARGKELSTAKDKLALAKRKAEEANQAKSEFLSLMSHELRTPLQAIIGYADVVIEELKLEGVDAYTTDLNRVINNSQRLLRLINSVLDLSKIESGRMDVNLKPINLETIVEDAVANIRPLCDSKRLQLSANASNGPSQPIADAEKLLHIILNLLSNACKFTETGVIKIVAEHRKGEIYISVQDSGPGIPPEQIPYIFDRFKQADGSTTRRHQGSGLGLAISKQFCELMGGSIEVHSELHMGTTFTISIPQPQKSNIALSPALSPNTSSESINPISASIGVDTTAPLTSSILIIDDDDEFINIMTRTLSGTYYTVFSAVNAKEGLKLAQELKPSLIIMDLLLPDIHGWELFKSIKEIDTLKGTPIIIASVLDEKAKGQLLGADSFLIKPVDRKTLTATVNDLTTRLDIKEKEHL